jgi:hypothetical protein
MRWIFPIVLLLAAAGWLAWFAFGLGAAQVIDRVLFSRHIPDDAVITPYVRVDGSIHGDFICRCDARTTWYEIRWVERQDQDQKWKGFENVAVAPRWDRVLSVSAIAAGLGVIWFVAILRRRKLSRR